MLDSALAASVAGLTAATVLLVLLGRRRMAGAFWRLAIAAFSIVVLGYWSSVDRTAGPLLVGTVVAAGVLLAPRRWWAVGSLFLASLLTASVVYGVYLAHATALLADSPLSFFSGLILLALEVAAMAIIAASAFEMIDAICADPHRPPLPPSPERWPVVCLQVPAYNEPPDLLIETIRSLVAIDYPDVRIQVIDNNTTDEDLWRPVEAECARLVAAGHRVDFVHLPEWPGYKAGALNWGRSHLAADVEVVGVVDADYLADPGWLRATIPYFSDPGVAFVQTPQDYREWEQSAFYRACYIGFAYFFKVGMVSRAHRNAIIFAGTMGLMRRAVLDQVGGWDERIITEDAEISLRVLARGYRSVYVPQAFGHGIMPLTYEGLRKQRFRWAFGGIQILRRHWRALLRPGTGLTIGQRYDHLMGGLWWFNDALTLGFTVFVVATAAGMITGRPFVVQQLTGIGLVLPTVFLILNLIRYIWALGATTRAGPALSLAALRVNLSLSWVIALACMRGLTQERGVFLRTPKFAGAPVIREIRLVWVETTIGAGSVLLLVLVLARAGFAPSGLVVAGLIAWAAIIYGSATGFALGDPSRAPIGEGLRRKMALELAPRLGRAVRSRPARVGLASAVLGVFALTAALVAESGRPPSAQLPLQEAPAGPVQGPFLGIQPGSTAAPVATASPSRGGPAPTASTSTPVSSAAAGRPTPSPTLAAITPTPVSHPTPKQTAAASHPTPQPGPTHILPSPSRKP